MIIIEDAICNICKKIFCCGKCCLNHKFKIHAFILPTEKEISPKMKIEENKTEKFNDNQIKNQQKYIFCPLCEEKPLALEANMFDEILEHISKNHLPLKCKKCTKIYSSSDDLKEFSKCFQSSTNSMRLNENIEKCSLTALASTKYLTKAMTKNNISTQTSPLIKNNDYQLTPRTSAFPPIMNFQWKINNKLTTHEALISDSLSSIKNMSSINNSSIKRHSIEITRGKLVRSTSTPVQSEIILLKSKELAFNDASNGQVSSIYNSGSESDNSPATELQKKQQQLQQQAIYTPTKQLIDNVYKNHKFGYRSTRIAAITPLRQVMSKSIQKALAEHRGLTQTQTQTQTQCTINKNEIDFSNAPLDLRLSPALRRMQNKYFETPASTSNNNKNNLYERRKILCSTKNLTTESIVITRTECLSQIENKSLDEANNINFNIENTSASTSSLTNKGRRSSSIYKTCHSVEIITSSAVDELNIQNNDDDFTSKENFKNIYSMEANNNANREDNNLNLVSPITRVPTAINNNNAILFEKTPIKLEKTAQNECHLNCTPEETFYTPNATFDSNSISNSKYNFPKRKFESYSKLKRPSIRKISNRKTFELFKNDESNNNKENQDNNVNKERNKNKSNENKERNESKERNENKECNGSEERNESNERNEYDENKEHRDNCKEHSERYKEHSERYKEHSERYKNRNQRYRERNERNDHNERNKNNAALQNDLLEKSKSLWTLVSSVINFPSISEVVDNGTKSTTSILRRCASIAGSLVRTKSNAAEVGEQLQTLKRKRTYTLDNSNSKSTNYYMSDNSDSDSTKYFRVQCRKPIKRMRIERK